MKTAIASTMIVVGLMIAAGSAGDCDGQCMSEANTMSEMLVVMMIGLTTSAVGAILLLGGKTNQES